MRKSPFYYDKCDTYAIGSLVGIQAEILSSSLHPEVRKEKGFLSYVVCEKTLLASIKIDLVRIAVRKKSGLISGMIIGMSPSHADHIAYLRPMVKEVLDTISYPCFMQMCVDPENRRKKIATELLKQLEYEAKRQNFQAIVTEIPNSNEVGSLFLAARGFIPVPALFLPECRIFYKKFKPLRK